MEAAPLMGCKISTRPEISTISTESVNACTLTLETEEPVIFVEEDILSFIHLFSKVFCQCLSSRTDKMPGQFKDKNNRAGETYFVDFKLVRGTLIKGFEFYQALANPFSKAAYMMFLISEVHPFLDGNGRIARVMMNAELTKEGQSKIIIPTVFREDYMGALRKLTRQSSPDAYIRMLQRAQEFSATIFDDDMNKMEKHLKESNAFKEHTEAKLKKSFQRSNAERKSYTFIVVLYGIKS